MASSVILTDYVEGDRIAYSLDCPPDMTRNIKRSCALAICAIAMLTGVSSVRAQSDDTQVEFWPEAQVHLTVAPQTKIILLSNVSRARETGTSLEGQLGISLDYRFDDTFSVRTGYRYSTSLVEDDPSTEHRILFEQTFRFRFSSKFLLSLRTREDLRFIDSEFSARIRERAMIERDSEIEGYTFTPYGSAEVYYDTRFDSLNRNRFILGVVFPVTNHFSVDIYGARQNDNRSSPNHVNALGLTLTLSY